MNINKKAFKAWLESNYSYLTPATRRTIYYEAFYITRHNVGLTLEEVLSGSKSRNDVLDALHAYLLAQDKKPGTRPHAYAAHLEYLLIYLDELNPGAYKLSSWELKLNHHN